MLLLRTLTLHSNLTANPNPNRKSDSNPKPNLNLTHNIHRYSDYSLQYFSAFYQFEICIHSSTLYHKPFIPVPSREWGVYTLHPHLAEVSSFKKLFYLFIAICMSHVNIVAS